MEPSSPLWAISDSAPRSQVVGIPRCQGHVATFPIGGPLLILPPAPKGVGSPRRQGLCSHLAHSWATSDPAPRSQAVGIPETARVM